MKRTVILISCLLAVLAGPARAQEEADTFNIPFDGPPVLVPFSAENMSRAVFEKKILRDSLRPEDSMKRHYTTAPLNLRRGPADTFGVVTRLAGRSELWIGRRYENGWAQAVSVPPGKNRYLVPLGWLFYNDAPVAFEPPPPDHLPKASGRAGAWQWWTGEDPINDAPHAVARVRARNSIGSDDIDARLVLDCKGERRKIGILSPMTFLASEDEDGIRVQLRVDREEPWEGTAGEISTYDGVLLPERWHRGLYSELKAGGELVARLFDDAGTPHTLRFSLAGIGAAAAHLYCFSSLD